MRRFGGAGFALDLGAKTLHADKGNLNKTATVVCTTVSQCCCRGFENRVCGDQV